MKFWIVYVITCNAPGENHGKQYVGQCIADASGSSAKRWKTHLMARTHNLRPLYAAIRAHGREAFTIDDLICCRSRNDALECERAICEMVNSRFPNGFNVAGSVLDPSIDPARSAERSAKARENWEMHREKRLNALAQDDVKERRIAGLKASWQRPEVAEKRIAGIRAAWARPGAKKRRVAALKEAIKRPEVAAKRSAAVSTWQSRPEMKPILSARARARWHNKSPEEQRAWLAKGIHSPAEIAKTTQRLIAFNRKRFSKIKDERQLDML